MAVNADLQPRYDFNAVTERGDFTVHTHAACFNNGFDFTARTVAGTRQHFL